MNAVVSKVLTTLLTAALSSLTPAVLSAVLAKVKVSIPSFKGSLFATELEQLVMKAFGYSTIPALAVGVLTYLSAHDGDYIKNSTLCYFASAALGLAISTIRQAYAGEDPSLATPSPSSPTMPPSTAPKLAEVANVPIAAQAVETPCPAGECKFSGKVIEPTAPTSSNPVCA